MVFFAAIAHRGLHTSVPENTIAAFQRAAEAGADGVELDVHVTHDGVPVVHHDAIMDAPVSETSLRGRSIPDLTSMEVHKFDLGGGLHVPTLAQCLEAIPLHVTIYVEVKTGEVEVVAAALRGAWIRVAVHSFDHRLIARFGRVAPDIPRGVLQVGRPLDPVHVLAQTAARDLWQHVDLLDQDLVAAVHARNGRVIAWTANGPAVWARLAALGVDGICTDRVDQLVEWRARSVGSLSGP